jgi:mono/diheme cytochrome c family protein
MKYHVVLSVFLIVTALASSFTGCQTPNGGSESVNSTIPVTAMDPGEQAFNGQCAACHAGGGNLSNPAKPVKGSLKVKNLKQFTAFVRNPGGGMPAYSAEDLTDKQVSEIQNYLLKTYP